MTGKPLSALVLSRDVGDSRDDSTFICVLSDIGYSGIIQSSYSHVINRTGISEIDSLFDSQFTLTDF